MPDLYQALASIAEARASDPLAPVTVVAPSHAAALHLRRRLAQITPFAAVRFETLPRVAELIGAGPLAAANRAPLARPIGDYVAAQVASQSRGALADVSALPGYARTLRQIFRRLRRAGVTRAAEVPPGVAHGHLPEVLRLYDFFRRETAAFYDPEDLQEAAAEAVETRAAGVLSDIGDVYVVPPGALTAASNRLLEALRAVSPAFHVLDDPSAVPQQHFTIAPDPASEAREVVRHVIAALESGVPIDEIAVFHGSDAGYARLLREAFASASIPCVPLPGIPLIETRAGRGVLALGALPQKDFSRAATIEFLSVAPVRDWLPGGDDTVREMTPTWDKLSRDAGVTHGVDAWRQRLHTMYSAKAVELGSLASDASESRVRAVQFEHDETARLIRFIEALISCLEPLRESQPADTFIGAFKRVTVEYLRPNADALTEVLEEIDQLGTVAAVGGSFTLDSFITALRANLELAHVRPTRLGDGVVIADYRTAPGLRFQGVFLCGAYEGAFPGGPGADAIIDDAEWHALKSHFPHTEDAETRIARARADASRAIASAGDGEVSWSAPAYEPGGTREYYPSPAMAQAFSDVADQRVTASELRRRDADALLTRARSPLAVALRGHVIDRGELGIRRAVAHRRAELALPDSHPLHRPVTMLRARRSDRFTEWDGNLASLPERDWLPTHVSPTSLENYGACGYKYFARSVLRLNVVEEPDVRDMMEPARRGSLIHDVLETFFREKQEERRPAVDEAWTSFDLNRLLAILDEALADARSRGLTGLPIYAAHEARAIRADLARFLAADSAFRQSTHAIPTHFERELPPSEVAGIVLKGRVDRIDTRDDGHAWVIDYKTGSKTDFEKIKDNPLDEGRKLQLPTYIAAAEGAQHVQALYWFITQRGEYAQVPYEPTEELDARFAATLEAIIAGVGVGAFPAVPGDDDDWRDSYTNCRYCDFDRICSRRREAEYPAKSADNAMLPWHGVADAARPAEQP